MFPPAFSVNTGTKNKIFFSDVMFLRKVVKNNKIGTCFEISLSLPPEIVTGAEGVHFFCYCRKSTEVKLNDDFVFIFPFLNIVYKVISQLKSP